MADGIRIGLDEVVVHFSELEDPRSEINRQHPLVSVVVIALMAVLAGASGPTAIAKWARIKEDLLRKLLPLPNGIPRKDVFRRVLSALQPGAFQACFVNWLQSLRDAAAVATGIDQPVLAVDGKTLRRSHDVTYREDESRIREKHLRENFAWLNRFTLSLLKQHPGKDSLVMKRRCCGWNDNFLVQTLTGATS